MRACMLPRPSSINSGFSCCMANITVKTILLKAAESRANRPLVQCFIIFITSLKKPSLNSGNYVVSCLTCSSVQLHKVCNISGSKPAKFSPICFIIVEKSKSTSGSRAFMLAC